MSGESTPPTSITASSPSSPSTSPSEVARRGAPRPAPSVARAASRRDLFGGVGEVKVWSLMHPNALNPFRASLWCELEPRGVVGAHVQERYPEIVLCIAGEGAVSAGERVYDFRPGACVPLAQGEILRIENRLDSPLSYLIIKAE